MAEKDARESSSAQTKTSLPVVRHCSYNLFYAPNLTLLTGTTPESEKHKNPGSEYVKNIENSFRTYEEMVSYPPNQVFIGNLDPDELPEKPWFKNTGKAPNSGPFGRILDEPFLYALIRFADVFKLVIFEKDFSIEAEALLKADDAMEGADYTGYRDDFTKEQLEKEIKNGALPLTLGGKIVGCVKDAHPDDINLRNRTILENLISKGTGIYAVRRLLADSTVSPESIGYIIETSEEACGDMNQRGGGNFAKAIGELSGLVNATGSDTRSFCAGPVHGLIQAASLVASGTFSKVILAAGGSSAKLAMNSKKHISGGYPVLEDSLGSFAVLIERDAEGGIVLRNDIVGTHKIGSGASPQAVINDLVVNPLYSASYHISDVDRFAPELQNSEITEAAGAGNVTLANLKMIAAMAVIKKEIERPQMGAFIDKHGLPGWAPTQGHIPSGIPALGWFVKWANAGKIKRGLIIGKGSLFLGRMTNLFDGVSILAERNTGKSSTGNRGENAAVHSETTLIGIAVPGLESDESLVYSGAEEAEKSNPLIKVKYYGKKNGDPKEAQRELTNDLASGRIDGAVMFHYSFPIGTATVGRLRTPGSGSCLFLATTTGTMSSHRVKGLVLNTIAGIAAAKAYGVTDPSVGFLNLDGAVSALKAVKQLSNAGYRVNLKSSYRGDALLRGNDILSGTADVVVCDSLTGNVIIKLLSAYSTAGRLEVAGSGYGIGLGNMENIISIISRASGAPVIADAVLFTARMVKNGLLSVYREELAGARKAGLDKIIKGLTGEPDSEGGANYTAMNSGISSGTALKSGISEPAREPVESEIEGIDVLSIDKAVELLKGKGIYCEPGMGCTGPVIMVSGKKKRDASKILKGEDFI